MAAFSNSTYTLAWTASDTADTSWYALDSGAVFAPTLSVEPPKPKTALDWLDERVNEMRVKL